MSLILKIIRNISSIVIIFPITILQMLYLFFHLHKKKNIFIYHHGWGVGHSLHDVEYFRKTYIPEETTVIFFNNGKHNILLSESFTDISIRFIKIFVNIPLIKKKLTYHNKISFLFHDLFLILINLLLSLSQLRFICSCLPTCITVQLDFSISFGFVLNNCKNLQKN